MDFITNYCFVQFDLTTVTTCRNLMRKVIHVSQDMTYSITLLLLFYLYTDYNYYVNFFLFQNHFTEPENKIGK